MRVTLILYAPLGITTLGHVLGGMVHLRPSSSFPRERASSSFWSRMQVELLDRRRWETRVELANAIFE